MKRTFLTYIGVVCLAAAIFATCDPPAGQCQPTCASFGVTIPNQYWEQTQYTCSWTCCDQNLWCPGSNPNPGIRFTRFVYQYHLKNGGSYCYDTGHYYRQDITPQVCCQLE